MQYPDIHVQVTRGGITESEHRIRAVIVSSDGNIVDQWGDVSSPVYPRSAIKGLQVLAFVERGGVERFGFTEAELALCCASHNGEPEHVAAAQSMLDKLQCSEADYECGTHWPMRLETACELAHEQHSPDQRHNNCSGKHAGMLGLAKLLEVNPNGYIQNDHPVQQTIAATMSQMCGIDMSEAPHSPDGCSAPTWAIPLTNLALGFARFADPSALVAQRANACQQIYHAAVTHPFMVAGTDRYCSTMMSVLRERAFLKVGAEGVYIAAIPSLKLAIAMKCDDGASRAVEVVMTALLDKLGITEGIDDTRLNTLRAPEIRNRNNMLTGTLQCELP